MMEKYPVGIYFSTFKIYVEDAIKNEPDRIKGELEEMKKGLDPGRLKKGK